jgi:hypothetical protein
MPGRPHAGPPGVHYSSSKQMKKIVLFGALLIAAGLSSCSKDDAGGSSTATGKASVSFHLTDAPGAYDAVNVDIRQVVVITDQGETTLTPVKAGVYNLLEFSNGLDVLLCQSDLPAGHISQMRLVLGSNNSVVVDGKSYPLNTPSAQQSGLKFNFHQELKANASYHVWIDFDAGKSVVKTGKDSYNLKPTVRAYTELTNGKIKGVVLPLLAQPIVFAIKGSDTLSAIPASDGHFVFSGLAEGNYSLWYNVAAGSGFSATVKTNVAVSFGTITDVGTVTLLP